MRNLLKPALLVAMLLAVRVVSAQPWDPSVTNCYTIAGNVPLLIEGGNYYVSHSEQGYWFWVSLSGNTTIRIPYEWPISTDHVVYAFTSDGSVQLYSVWDAFVSAVGFVPQSSQTSTNQIVDVVTGLRTVSGQLADLQIVGGLILFGGAFAFGWRYFYPGK